MSPEAEKERVRRWNEWWMEIEKSLKEGKNTLLLARQHLSIRTATYTYLHTIRRRLILDYLAGGEKSQNKNFDNTISTI
jgi:hypothetical protein